MWTCRDCETKNNDGDAYCACCGAPKPASAPTPSPRTQTGANQQQGTAPRPTQGPGSRPAQAYTPTKSREPAEREPRRLSYEEKRLMALNDAIHIPPAPTTRANIGCGTFVMHMVGSFLLGTLAGALLCYIPVWIFGDLFMKLGAVPLLTSEMVDPFLGPAVILGIVLYWVIVLKDRKDAATFDASWDGSELVCSWIGIKESNLAVGIDGRWIAFGDYVENGSWRKIDGKIYGLSCAWPTRPQKAVLAKINLENGVTPKTANYISAADVR